MFGQVEDPSRPAREGTGLGLTIARGLAERMGGTLDLASRPGEGTVLTLALPLAPDGDLPDLPHLPAEVAIPSGGGSCADLAADRLARLGVRVARRVTPGDPVVLLPLSLSAGAQAATLAALGPMARFVALGRREAAVEGVFERADAILAVPVAGADLLAALTGGVGPGAAAPGPASGSPRILLADDNATNRLLLDRMLCGQGMRIQIVPDGAQAVEAYATCRPDVVVLDISMPGMDGFDTAAAIRDLEFARGGDPAPLLGLTAHSGEDMSARLREAGFEAHLTKPVRKDDLLAALATAIVAQASRT